MVVRDKVMKNTLGIQVNSPMKKLLGQLLFHLVYLPGDLACHFSYRGPDWWTGGMYNIFSYLMGKSIDINDKYGLHHWKDMEEGGEDGV